MAVTVTLVSTVSGAELVLPRGAPIRLHAVRATPGELRDAQAVLGSQEPAVTSSLLERWLLERWSASEGAWWREGRPQLACGHQAGRAW